MTQKLTDNYRENGNLYAKTTGLPEGDRRLDTAKYAFRWGLLRGEAYGKLLEEIKADLLAIN